jgi:hypothetical protein
MCGLKCVLITAWFKKLNLRRVVPSCRGVLPVLCDLEISTFGGPEPEVGCCDTEKEIEA